MNYLRHSKGKWSVEKELIHLSLFIRKVMHAILLNSWTLVELWLAGCRVLGTQCHVSERWTCIPNNFLFLFLVILLYLWISQGFSWLSQGFSWHLKSNLIKPAKFDCIWIVNIKGHSTLIWINALNVLQGLRNPPDSSPCNNKTEGFVWANYWSSEWWCLRILHCLASVV